MCSQTVEAESLSNQKYIHFFNANRDVELGVVQSGFQITEPGYKYGPLIRDHYLVHFVKSGKGKLYLQKMVYEVDAGNCFLIYPHQIAYYQADLVEPWEYYWLGLCGFNAEKILQVIGFDYDRMVIPFKNEKICKTITKITDEGFKHKTEEMTIYLQLGSLLRKVLYHLLDDNRGNNGANYIKPMEDTGELMGKGKYVDQYVNIVSKIIHNSYTENIKVEKIAEKLNINRSYLSATFKENTGMAIKEYLTNYRIEKSCGMLHNKHIPISDISNAVGFDDPFYFSRVFKKQMGCSPSEYRNGI